MSSLVEAIEQKFGESASESEGEDDGGISISIFVPRKSQRMAVPSLLVLNDCDIATAGEKRDLIDKCAGVEELDLAKNKLSYWNEVLGILQLMPRLKFVNLSFNQLNAPLQDGQVDKNFKWQHLSNLVLNNTHVDWKSVREILDHSPSLEELHLSLNDYNDVQLCPEHSVCKKCCDNQNDGDRIRFEDGAKEIDGNEKNDKSVSNENNVQEVKEEEHVAKEDSKKCTCPKFATLKIPKKHKHLGIKKLHFTGNPVVKWTEVCKIGYAFPNLESLVLAECPIDTLDLVDDSDEDSNRNYSRMESECESGISLESPHDSFRKLKVLNLNSTQLSTWDEIERLAKFPALHCLRIQGCPLWDTNEYTEHERRQLIIARLPNIEMLNGGGNIEPDEREDAERAFIRYYMEKPESERPDRYFELINIHGKLDPLVNVDLRPEKRVKVTFTCGSNSEIRSVDVYRTVSDLKSKLEGFAGFSAAKMRLFYVDQDLRDIQGPEEMKFPHKQLYSYNISSGDEIIVDCKKK